VVGRHTSPYRHKNHKLLIPNPKVLVPIPFNEIDRGKSFASPQSLASKATI
jgi:hypothetical protein